MSQQRLDFSKKSVKEKYFFDLTFTDVHMGCQKVPKSDFQSQLSRSKIILQPHLPQTVQNLISVL